MTRIPAKFLALVVAMGLVSFSARADVVRSTNGEPVRSTNGECVLNQWTGGAGCATPMSGAYESSTIDSERVVYFGFNKASLDVKARHKLDHLAHHLHWMGKRDHMVETITAVGFADRIGNAGYNQKLAMKRAVSVRNYLVAKGVKAKKIEVRSLGKSEPRADCPADLPRKKLISCLSEDRRVEVQVQATPISK